MASFARRFPAPFNEVAEKLPRLKGVPLRRADWILAALVAAVTTVGIFMIYSATQRSVAATAWDDLVVKQIVFACVGVALLVATSLTDYRVLLSFGLWIYVLTVGTLTAVLLTGSANLGSARWFSAGVADLQPSEFAKVGVILFLAAYFDRFDIRRMRHVLFSLALVGLASFLVLRQPNLSTAALILVIWVAMAYVAGIRPLHMSLIALAALPVAIVVLRGGLIQPYMMNRVVAWLDPMIDPLGEGFQNIQTLIAVANGGLLGSGFASGPLAKGGWLVVLHTDNIFALVAEELGFVGGLAVLALLVLIVLRVLRAAALAQDRAGRLIAAGVATYILSQTAVNVGVVLQLLPVTGVSLPFVSYGGSSLLALYASVGLVQSLLLRRKPLEFT